MNSKPSKTTSIRRQESVARQCPNRPMHRQDREAWPRIRTRFRIDQKRIHDRSRTDEKLETLSSPRDLL
jgi:hypothetical protein